ncbi:MAG: YgiT-type zinc finger protein [Chloroflexota bacterium]
MQPCPNCHLGRMKFQKIPYVQWYDHENIVVGRISAIVCDRCGEKSYDMQAVEHLQRLIWSQNDDESTFPFARPR